MADPAGPFEMRRLEQLSNTIFGVAMTLLAYDLPRANLFTGVPDWADLIHHYGDRVMALMLSFIIAGVFWLSHHRRLAMAPYGSRGMVFLNLLFLMSIIVLPATNGLLGSYRHSSVVATIYGVHLTLIASLNAALWLLALHGRGERELLISALFPVGVLLLGTAVAIVAPGYAQVIWFFAFGAPILGWLSARRQDTQVPRA
jgi:uncharacterized membrane protein